MKETRQIELKNADIIQGNHRLLSKVNLSVEAGEFIYIIGKVGTGKTSLIKTLHAELPLASGYGKVAGFNLPGIKHREIALLRRKTGVIFQDFRLLQDRSVFENLSFVLKATGWKNKKAIASRIDDVLEQVNMADKKEKMPHQLSGGEQQRIAIARAILNHPVIVLADEPTGNLDPETSEEILRLFIQLNKQGKTIVMATHDHAVIAQNPARTLGCANGKVSDSASVKTLLDFEELLTKN